MSGDKDKDNGNPTLGGSENKPGQTEKPYKEAGRPERPVDRKGEPVPDKPKETPTPNK